MRRHLFTQKDSTGSQRYDSSAAAPEALPVLRRPVVPAQFSAWTDPHTHHTLFQVSSPQPLAWQARDCPPAPLGRNHSTRSAPRGWAASAGWFPRRQVPPHAPGSALPSPPAAGSLQLMGWAPWGPGAGTPARCAAGSAVRRGSPVSPERLAQGFLLGPQPGPRLCGRWACRSDSQATLWNSGPQPYPTLSAHSPQPPLIGQRWGSTHQTVLFTQRVVTSTQPSPEPAT